MIQPKFKFGDKLVSINSERIFIVRLIISLYIENPEFAYSDTIGGLVCYDESELKLYVKPKPKVKLYEYIYKLNGEWNIYGILFKSDNEACNYFLEKKFKSTGREFEVDDE